MSTRGSDSKSRRRASGGGGGQPFLPSSSSPPAVMHGRSPLVFPVLEVDTHHGDFGATLWMPPASMLSASLSTSQLVSVSVYLQHSLDASNTSQVENLEERFRVHFGIVMERNLEEQGSFCVAASAWPCSKLKEGVRISKQLACALGCAQPLPYVRVRVIIGAGINACVSLKLPGTEILEMDVQDCQELVVRLCTAKAKDNHGDTLEGQLLVSKQIEESPLTPASQHSKTMTDIVMRKVEMSSSSKIGEASSAKTLKKRNAPQRLSQSKEKFASSLMLGDKDGRAFKLLERLAGRLLSGRYLMKGNFFAISVCGQDCFFQVVNAIKPLRARSSNLDGGQSNASEGKMAGPERIQMPTLFLIGSATQVKLELSIPSAKSTQVDGNAAGDGALLKPFGMPLKQIEYSALGGLSEQISTLKEIINFSLLQPERLLRLAAAPWCTSSWSSRHREDISCPRFCH